MNPLTLTIRCAMLTILVLIVSPAMAAHPWTPIDWQDKGRLRNWRPDEDGNFIADHLETLEGRVDIIVDLNRCLGDPDASPLIAFLNSVGDVAYVGKYLSFVIVRDVSVSRLGEISERSEVAMIEPDLPMTFLGTGLQSLNVEESGYNREHNLQLEDYGWPSELNGEDVTVAIVDTGVTNLYADFSSAQIAEFDVLTGADSGVEDEAHFHGSVVAQHIVGNTNGIARGAKIVDIKFATLADLETPHNETEIHWGALSSNFLIALEKVIEKRDEWGIDVVCTATTIETYAGSGSDGRWFPLGDGTEGRDVVSNMVDVVVSKGIIFTCAIPHRSPDYPDSKRINPPATAALAISVGAAETFQDSFRGDDEPVSVRHSPDPRVASREFFSLKPEVVVPAKLESETFERRWGGKTPSIASGYTAGLAALVLQKKTIPPGSFKDLLIRTAEDRNGVHRLARGMDYPRVPPTWDADWGYGYVDAYTLFETFQKEELEADLSFRGYDNSEHPDDPWYLSPAIRITRVRDGREVETVEPGEGYDISARIVNYGPNPAYRVKVNFGFYSSTAGIGQWYPIDDTVVDLPHVYAGDSLLDIGTTEATVYWVPPEFEHGCLKVNIDFAYDNNYGSRSNEAQRNLQVGETGSPAKFNFHVENPLIRNARIELSIRKQYPDWKVKLTETRIEFDEYGCPRQVGIEIDPPATTAPGTVGWVYVTSRAFPENPRPEEANGIETGGVAFKVRVAEE